MDIEADELFDIIMNINKDINRVQNKIYSINIQNSKFTEDNVLDIVNITKLSNFSIPLTKDFKFYLNKNIAITKDINDFSYFFIQNSLNYFESTKPVHYHDILLKNI